MFLSDSQGTANTVRRLRHDLLLNFSEESLFEGTDRRFSHVHVEHPYPIHKPLKTSEDSVKKDLEEQKEYSRLLEIERRRFKSDKGAIEKKKYAKSKYVYLPKYLLKFYQQKNPDPTFNCDYNFYYTGGVLEHIEFNNEDYLIRPDVDNNLCMTHVKNGDMTKLNYSSSSLIYGLYSVKTEGGLFLVLREKQKVSVLEFSDTFSISLRWSKDYKMPVFDAKLNEDEPRHLGVTLFDKFIIENIYKSSTVWRIKNGSELDKDSFQRIQFLSDSEVLLMNRYTVKVLDYRDKTEKSVSDLKLIDCNSLCTFSVLGNTLLLGTRHYVIKTDLRNLTEISYFSHSLDRPPCYMDYAFKGSDTYLCVAGHDIHSKVLFTGHSPYSLPYRVPSISDTLKESRLSFPSLVLEKHLDDRLNFSTTGLKVLNLNDEIAIFSSNCLGEIFKQKVFDYKQDTKNPAGVLFEWVSYLEKPEPVLHLTLVEEVSKARFALNSNPKEHKLKKYSSKGKSAKFLAKFAPRYSKKNIQGTLAQDFAKVWEDEEEEDDEEEQVDDLPEDPAYDRVNSWIQTHDFSDDEANVSLLNISQGIGK